MSMAYSIDFIKRAVAYKQEGHTLKQLQEAFGIPAETYYDWKEKLENGFNFGIKAKGERRRKIDKIALEQAVKETPDAFLLMKTECYVDEHGAIQQSQTYTASTARERKNRQPDVHKRTALHLRKQL